MDISTNTILYHGSRLIIKQPEFGKGNYRNDYGRGFYCTHEIELAKEWACSESEDGYVNCYELNMLNMNVLKLTSNSYHVLNWLAILAKYRTFRASSQIAPDAKEYLLNEFLIDISPYDIIIGYRADDSYFSFANAFVNNEISLQQLSKSMYYGALGEQVVIKSKKAFAVIKFISFEIANSDMYYVKKQARAREAKDSYKQERKTSDYNGLYMIDILRERIDNNDPRLRW